MGSFFSTLMSPGSWNETQLLAFCIGLFVLVASFYFVWRLYRIIKTMGKSTYKPNIGLSRMRLKPGDDRTSGNGGGSSGDEKSKSE